MQAGASGASVVRELSCMLVARQIIGNFDGLVGNESAPSEFLYTSCSETARALRPRPLLTPGIRLGKKTTGSRIM